MARKAKTPAGPATAASRRKPARPAPEAVTLHAPQAATPPLVPHRVRMLGFLPRGATVAEVGVWKGDYASVLLDRLEPKELHLIDPWLYQPQYPSRWYGGASARSQDEMDRVHRAVRARFADRPNVVFHRQGSVEALNTFGDGALDIVYIDGDHSFEAVLQDLVLAHRKVRPGGYICADDWAWKDERGRTSVREAVLAYLQMHLVDFVHVRDQQVMIRRPAGG